MKKPKTLAVAAAAASIRKLLCFSLITASTELRRWSETVSAVQQVRWNLLPLFPHFEPGVRTKLIHEVGHMPWEESVSIGWQKVRASAETEEYVVIGGGRERN
jgi:hypothetical protein